MKVRHLKHYHQAQAAAARLPQIYYIGDIADPVQFRSGLAVMTKPSDDEVEAYKKEYVVVKKSTQEVVGTFDLEADALAMIDKAKKQKKAALELLQ